MLVRVNVPQFLDAQAIDLRLTVGLKIVFRLELLGQMAARTLCKQGVFRLDLHARLKIAFVAAIFGDAHVLRNDPGHRASIVEHNLCRRKTREHHHAQRFGLLAQPPTHIAERAGIASRVTHEWRHHQMRHVPLAVLGQRPMPIISDWRFCHRAVHLAPIREQLVQRFWINHSARQNMRTDFRPFFKDDNF